MLLHANNFSFQLAVTATRYKLDIHVILPEAPVDIREDVREEHHQQAEAPCPVGRTEKTKISKSTKFRVKFHVSIHRYGAPGLKKVIFVHFGLRSDL